jgi:hypothetical protein
MTTTTPRRVPWEGALLTLTLSGLAAGGFAYVFGLPGGPGWRGR